MVDRHENHEHVPVAALIDDQEGALLDGKIAESLEVTDVGPDGVFAFTSFSEYAHWLKRRNEWKDFVAVQHFLARARRSESDGETAAGTAMLKERQERVATYNDANLRAHGASIDDLRDPIRANHLLRTSDPCRGPVANSGALFEHCSLKGQQFWLTAYEAWPWLSWMNNKASSLQFFGGSIHLYGKTFFRGKHIRFRPIGGWWDFNTIPCLVQYGWNDRASSAAHTPW